MATGARFKSTPETRIEEGGAVALVPVKLLLEYAKRGGYGVAAFNVYDMQSIQAVVEVAESEDSPVILAGWEGHLTYAGIDYFSSLARTAAKRVDVPVAVHLDHGTSLGWVSKCIQHGFTSVMIDASGHSFDENVAITKQVVEFAHPAGVTVEAELGHMPTGDQELTARDREAYFTDPDQAVEFVKKTGVDALAVSIGTAHGLYRFEPKLDLKRLEEIASRVDAYIVLHGGTGTPGLPQAIKLGVTKINIGAALRVAFRESVQSTAKDPSFHSLDPTDILDRAKQAQKEVIKEILHSFGSRGKATQMMCDLAGHRHISAEEPL